MGVYLYKLEKRAKIIFCEPNLQTDSTSQSQQRFDCVCVLYAEFCKAYNSFAIKQIVAAHFSIINNIVFIINKGKEVTSGMKRVPFV